MFASSAIIPALTLLPLAVRGQLGPPNSLFQFYQGTLSTSSPVQSKPPSAVRTETIRLATIPSHPSPNVPLTSNTACNGVEATNSYQMFLNGEVSKKGNTDGPIGSVLGIDVVSGTHLTLYSEKNQQGVVVGRLTADGQCLNQQLGSLVPILSWGYYTT
jgi:hypothetical protein